MARSSVRVAARLPLLTLLILLPSWSVAAEKYQFIKPVSAAETKYVGPGSCSATACHGSITARHETKVLQNEYSTWTLQDKHSRAQQVLNNAVSQHIAKILGLPNAATAPRCLDCHALQVPAADKAREFDVTDGVSCESCHGPAYGWLGSHTSKTATHEDNVARGLYDTKNLILRTQKCLTCHLGTKDKFVDHELIAAGHPDLVFELDSFQAVEPIHWDEKQPGNPAQKVQDPLYGVKMWSVGQAVQLKEAMMRLSRRAKGTNSGASYSPKTAWPEYAELDCFACHHSLTPPEESWRLVSVTDPGRLGSRGYYQQRRAGDPAYNTSRVVAFRHLVHAVDASSASQLEEQMNKLAAMVTDIAGNREQIASAADNAAQLADRLAQRLNGASFNAQQTMGVMHNIANDAEYISNQGERSAEQAAMALDSLYIAYAKQGGSQNQDARTAINALFKELENPSAYNANRFEAAMKRVAGTLR